MVRSSSADRLSSLATSFDSSGRSDLLSISVIPSMPLSGVRISKLIRARSSDLAIFASASCRRASSSEVISISASSVHSSPLYVTGTVLRKMIFSPPGEGSLITFPSPSLPAMSMAYLFPERSGMSLPVIAVSSSNAKKPAACLLARRISIPLL